MMVRMSACLPACLPAAKTFIPVFRDGLLVFEPTQSILFFVLRPGLFHVAR
jgi:hypothetical protein